MTTREKRILHSIDVSKQVGLELGPLSAPVVKKSQGEVYYLDLMSRADLIKQYESEPINPDDIVDVDYILKGRSLTETVKGKKFDYVVAAHVIEHLPDVVSWLQEVASILKPGGVLSLVIPDKRYTFDIQRSETQPGQIIGAYYDKLQKASPAMIYDFISNIISDVDTAKAWKDPAFYKNAKPHWTAQEAYQKCEYNRDPKHYVDCHCSVFTPQSFIEVTKALMQLDLLDYKVSHFVKTQPYELEFYVSFTKVAAKDRTPKALLATLPTMRPKPSTESLQLKEIVQLKQEISAITESVSWRATSPLRKTKTIQTKLKKRISK